MPSTSRQTRLQPAVDVAKAMPSVFGHREVVTLEVSDCGHAYEGRASERWPRLVGCVEPSMARFAWVEASGSYWSDSSQH